jgi:hypothetical protein
MEYMYFSRSARCPNRLLGLPAELREIIFEHALTSSKQVVAFRLLDDYQREDSREAIQPPLTRVSRQIRAESLPVFYRCNDFVLHADKSRLDESRRWLQYVEPHLQKLHRISILMPYVTLANHRSAASGAIRLRLRKSTTEGCWKTDERWNWNTVTRRPVELESDSKFLQAVLKSLLADYDSRLHTADAFVTVLLELRLMYVQEKMS